MRKSKFSEHQIIDVLRRAEAGVPVKDLCRELGIPLCQGSCRVHCVERWNGRGRQASEECRATVKASESERFR